MELCECTLTPENIVPATGKNLTNTSYVNACVGVCCNNISQYFPSTYYDAWPFDKCLICTSSFNLVLFKDMKSSDRHSILPNAA